MVFTNLKATEKNLRGLFESSALMSTDVGNIYDVIVRDENDKEVECDNGVAISVGSYTGDGLEERYATVATAKNKIAVVGTPANVKSAMTKAQEQAYNFTNAAGKVAKAYQIQDADVHTDIFGVASYQFTDATSALVKKGSAVVVDGKGAWEAHEATELESLKATNGFVGLIHSVSVGSYYTIVRIQVVQNKELA